MKNISGICIIVMLFSLVSFSSFSQKAFYFGPDATVNVNDSVVIRLNDYQGDIQWQKSLDLDVWENIPGAVHDTLLFVSDTTTYFRARVIAGDCDPFYSDTTLVGVHKLNEDVKIIDESETVLISDSTDLANGIYRFIGQLEGVQVGSVILGQQDEGFMRRVTAILERSNEYAFETEQANMEDVFDELSLQDSILITLDASKTFIHGGRPLPIEVLYLPPGAELKKDRSGIDFSNSIIFEGTIQDEENEDNYIYLKVGINEGYVNFEPLLKREFEYRKFINIPTRLDRMLLTVGGAIDAAMSIYVESDGQFTYSKKIQIAKFEVPVAIGPVPVTAQLIFYIGFNAFMEAELYASAGFSADYSVEFGGEYIRTANPQWQIVWERDANFTPHEPEFSFYGHLTAKGYIQPEIAMMITGMAGPTFSVDPYLRFLGEVDFPEWYWELGAGVGGHLGFRVGLFGWDILDVNFELFNWDNVIASGTSEIEIDLPVLATLPITSITSTTAQSGGNVTNDGGATVTARGVVWSTTPNPTIENNQGYTTDGSGIGEFVSNLTGLISETIYYVRAYATNSAGTGYGQQEDFTTDDNGGGNIQPGEGVTDIDGNFYPSVIIGNQEWMAENLRVTRDANGNSITRYCYNNDAANCGLYGGLYTWHTIMNGATSSNTNPSNVQGICPTGWHLPSDAEWTELVDYVVAQGYPNDLNNPNGAGNALKSCRQVSSPLGGDCATSEHPRWNSHSTHYGTDEFGFSALPGGTRGTNGAYGNLGDYGRWWSSSETSSPNAWYRYLSNDYGNVRRYGNSKGLGFSVRCVRD